MNSSRMAMRPCLLSFLMALFVMSGCASFLNPTGTKGINMGMPYGKVLSKLEKSEKITGIDDDVIFTEGMEQGRPSQLFNKSFVFNANKLVMVTFDQLEKTKKLKGKIEDEIYISALGNYKCRVPVDQEYYDRIEDSQYSVSFMDDAIDLLRIEGVPLASEDIAQETEAGREVYLQAFVHQYLLPKTIFDARPDAKIEIESFLPSVKEGAYLVLVRLRECSVNRNPVTKKRYDAKRLIICFPEKGFIYAATKEIPEKSIADTISINSDSAIEKAKSSLLAFIETIDFFSLPSTGTITQ